MINCSDDDGADDDDDYDDTVPIPMGAYSRQACIRRVSHTLNGCHAGTNVLCARVCPSAPGIVASGGADKLLLVSQLKQPQDVGIGSSSSSSERLCILNVSRHDVVTR